MKVVLISRGDARSGGAGRVAEQLAVGLTNRGYQITHFVRRKPRGEYKYRSKLIQGIKGDVLLRNIAAIDISGIRLLAQRELWRADLVHFHDHVVAYGALAGLLVSRKVPVVLTLHDFSGCTGGCLYPSKCRRFETGCGGCPLVGQWPLQLPVDLTRNHFRLNQRLAERDFCMAVTPSYYLADFARRGAWRNGRLEVIRNAVDTDLFRPEYRARGRELLRLPANAIALLFVATDVLDPRKGFRDLEWAYVRLASLYKKLFLVMVGRLRSLPRALRPFADRIRSCGLVINTRELASIYAAADLHVMPSYDETFALTPIEALSCGTLTVAYPSGAIPELCRSGKFIILTDRRSPDSLEAVLSREIEVLENGDTRCQVREQALGFGLDQFIEAHNVLYRRILARLSSE
jgi:glycosyltransferase involved in cell wall biosynthesis